MVRAKTPRSVSLSLSAGVLNVSTAGMMAFQPIRGKDGEIADFECMLQNTAAAQYLDTTDSGCLGRKLSEIFPALWEEGASELKQAALERRAAPEREIRYQLGERSGWFHCAVAPFENGIVLTFSDITGQKQSEQVLRQARDYLQTIVNQAPIGVFAKTADDRKFVVWNRTMEMLLGIPAEEALGKTDYDFFPKEQADWFEAKDTEVLETGKVRLIPEEPVSSPHLGTRLLETTKGPVYGRDGRPKFLLGISVDITEQRRAEEEKKKSDRILGAVAFVAECVLHYSSWEDSIPLVLEKLGEATHVDRIRVFVNRLGVEGHLLAEQRNLWAGGEAPALQAPGALDYRILDSFVWKNQLVTGSPIPLTRRDFSADLVTALGLELSESALLVPVLVKSTWWGFLLFDCCDRDRVFSAAEIDALKTAASILGAAIARQRVEAELADKASALEQAVKQMTEAKAEAERVAEYKSNFLAVMSHEMRTPLNGVIGMTSVLLDTVLSDEQREYVDTVKASGEALLYVINDILDYSKLEAEREEREELEFEPRSIAEETADLLAEQAQRNGLELQCTISPDVPERVFGDPGRLRQILLNLLSNAVKFTRTGEVVLRVRGGEKIIDGRLLRFEVQDTGIGMSPEVQRKLFQPFVQADVSTTRRYGGTGLGLAICKRLVTLLEGRIGLDSAEGAGTKFWFEIPVRVLVDAEEKAPEQRHLAGRRVLVFEANDYAWNHVAEHCAALGIACQRCVRAADALEELSRNLRQPCRYDAFLLGFSRDGAEGISLARESLRLLADRPGGVIPVLPHFRRPALRELRQLGITAFLLKPIREQLLAELLERAVHPPDTAELASGLAVEAESIPAKPLGRILVAEDNAVNQRVAVRMLEGLGYRVDLASNGIEAAAAVAERAYDAVLMDCLMPEMDGYAAARQIRANEGNGRRTVIIAMTAAVFPEDRERCRAAGMDDYLPKPVRKEDLTRTLQRWIHSAGPADSE